MSFQLPDDGETPTINLRTGAVTFSSLPRLIVGLVIGLAALGFVGWLVLGSVFDAPWYVAAPMSVMFGAAVVAWQVKSSWRGYAVSAALALSGLSWFAWWWVEHSP